jgi:hypothetical protein
MISENPRMGFKRGHRTMAIVSSLLLPLAGIACGNVSANGGSGGNGGGGGAGGAGGGPPPTTEQACDQFAQVFCDALHTCANFLVEVLYADATTCVSRTKLACMTDQSVPGIGRTPQDVVTCAAAVSAASCEDLVSNRLPDACENVPGPNVNGSGCGSSLQCQSGHCEKGDATCGTCAPRQAANGACTVDEGCVRGLVCANQKCVAPKDLGADCDAQSNPCRAKLYCDKNTHRCTMRVGAGSPCSSDNNACDPLQSVACNVLAASPTCQAVGVAAGGEPCGIVNGTLTICVELDDCAGASLTQPGSCAAPAGDGEACSDQRRCVPPASCVNGLCRLPSVASCPH